MTVIPKQNGELVLTLGNEFNGRLPRGEHTSNFPGFNHDHWRFHHPAFLPDPSTHFLPRGRSRSVIPRFHLGALNHATINSIAPAGLAEEIGKNIQAPGSDLHRAY